MTKAIFLGPEGSTFSHLAFSKLSEQYDVVPAHEIMPANSNREVLQLLVSNGGYASVAIETQAEGRVAEPLEAFIDLLQSFDNDSCPFHIIGAIQLRIHFCLMMNQDVCVEDSRCVLAHQKAFGACDRNLKGLGLPLHEVFSNGEAARLVSESPEFKDCMALGPCIAASKYNLKIVEENLEDGEAVTTFFLMGPKSHVRKIGLRNRALIVFKLSHEPGALVKALSTLSSENLNMIQIHSVHKGNHTYDFAVELDVDEDDMWNFKKAMFNFKQVVGKCICFGPFEVLSE